MDVPLGGTGEEESVTGSIWTALVSHNEPLKDRYAPQRLRTLLHSECTNLIKT